MSNQVSLGLSPVLPEPPLRLAPASKSLTHNKKAWRRSLRRNARQPTLPLGKTTREGNTLDHALGGSGLVGVSGATMQASKGGKPSSALCHKTIIF
jgi:hypothetical protein